MTTATIERLGLDEFEPGDQGLAILIMSGVEKAIGARTAAKGLLNSILGVGELRRLSFYRGPDTQNPESDSAN